MQLCPAFGGNLYVAFSSGCAILVDGIFWKADTLKDELGVSKFQNVIVASGTGFADALAGSYLAAQKNAPILLVRGANVNDVKNYIKYNPAM